jgi:hypothetical protein
MPACLSINELPHQRGAFLFVVYKTDFNSLYSLIISEKIDAFCFHKRINYRFELNFSVNVLGTYAITEMMLPLLEKTAPDARVITVSSGGMYTAPLTTDLQVTDFLNFSAASICPLSTNGVSNELF